MNVEPGTWNEVGSWQIGTQGNLEHGTWNMEPGIEKHPPSPLQRGNFTQYPVPTVSSEALA